MLMSKFERTGATNEIIRHFTEESVCSVVEQQQEEGSQRNRENRLFLRQWDNHQREWGGTLSTTA